MRFRSIALIVILALIGLFSALNWAAITHMTELNLLVADVRAPLGVVLLGLLVFLVAVFLVYIVYMQAAMLLDKRRIDKEIEHNREEMARSRELADQAELSRFTELRDYMQGELLQLDNRVQTLQGELLQRLDRLSGGVTATPPAAAEPAPERLP